LKKLQKWSRSYAATHLSSEEMAMKTAAVYELVLKSPKKTPPLRWGSLQPSAWGIT